MDISICRGMGVITTSHPNLWAGSDRAVGPSLAGTRDVSCRHTCDAAAGGRPRRQPLRFMTVPAGERGVRQNGSGAYVAVSLPIHGQ